MKQILTLATVILFSLGLCLVARADVESPKAVITDRHGSPVPERVAPNTVLVLSAKQSVMGSPKSAIWSATAGQQIEDVYDRDGFPLYVLAVGAEKEIVIQLIVAKGDVPASKTVRIVVDGTSPRPPPPPDPVPPEPGTKSFNIHLFYDVKTITPDVANLVNAHAWWTALRSRSHTCAIYTSGTQDSTGLTILQAASNKGVKPPFVAIVDGANVETVRLPKTTAEIDATIKRLGGK